MMSFATGTSVGRVAVDSLGVAIVLIGCIGVLGSLVFAALTDDRGVAGEPVVIAD